MKRNDLPPGEVMRANLLRVAELGTRQQWHRAASWYPECFELCASVADDFRIPADHVACMVAVGSVSAIWERQAILIRDQVAAILDGCDPAGIPSHGVRLTDMHRAKMIDVLTKGPRTLTGRKWIDFASAILGDRHAVAFDVWHSRALLGRNIPYDYSSPADDFTYEYCVWHVCRAASELGMCARTFSAGLWLIGREGAIKTLYGPIESKASRRILAESLALYQSTH